MAESPLQFKFIVIGCSGAGKTSILRRLCEDKFNRGTQSTVGIEYFTYVTNIENKMVKMMIWDTAGQERFYTIARAYFRNALGVILVYDITDRKSFDQLPRWLRDARVEADPHCTVILVGNKCDLKDQRVVSEQEAKEFAAKNELTYIETSAANNDNIQETFLEAGRDLLKKVAAGTISGQKSATDGGHSVIIPDPKTKNKKRNTCC
ncbi:Ras family protein [Trichomonas vaginalis G3]|uniref:Ras family protein n=2 Tax=Trichomonas vaginalis TaxID=5722 RepID=A0A8U0WQ33_TRIV3|nr:small Rab GTPase RabA5 [Trichomonas vaginalis G3]AAX97461.1 small Rab GTPase RabA5 [Trichomonas vaginalis]EAY11553.1 Ras family protein [Trichomonas vaginalis G3]KAI5489437.1 small Rab GTPase RabA5 [Trichomonas vaginalis G3]|eukprot:XP_001323776.1 Ras family protein [Trichomonas vaginalis G3]